jgi:hypothetical protein
MSAWNGPSATTKSAKNLVYFALSSRMFFSVAF